MHQHAIGKAHQRERKEQIKEKRKNAKKSNIRDSISGEEFYHIIHSVKNNHFVSSRKKVAIVMPYGNHCGQLVQ